MVDDTFIVDHCERRDLMHSLVEVRTVWKNHVLIGCRDSGLLGRQPPTNCLSLTAVLLKSQVQTIRPVIAAKKSLISSSWIS
jgi:hypothetical protein